MAVPVPSDDAHAVQPVRADVLGAEVYVAGDVGLGGVVEQVVAHLAREPVPLRRLRRGADLVRGLADVEMHVVPVDHVGPPVDDEVVVRHCQALRPVDLRADVVDPLVENPSAGVRIQVLVGLHAGPRRRAERVLVVVHPDPEGGDAELDPRLGRLDLAAQTGDERVDVVAPPVRK